MDSIKRRILTNKVILFSESTIDITPELVAKYQIEVSFNRKF